MRKFPTRYELNARTTTNVEFIFKLRTIDLVNGMLIVVALGI